MSSSKPKAAAIFDLDRTIIPIASPQILQRHLAAAGLAPTGGNFVSDAFFKMFEIAGESGLVGRAAKLGPRAAKGWSVEATEETAREAAEEIVQHLLPFARTEIDAHAAAGRATVLATTTPRHLVQPVADLIGFDHVIATKWEQEHGEFTGELDGDVVWGRGKRDAVKAWAKENGIDLRQSYAYSDSYYDSSLLASVGHPVAVNPDVRLAATAALRGWPVRYLDKPEGILKIAGMEMQELIRPFVRPELIPNADIDIEGIDNIPAEGGALVVANHRSYFDPIVITTIIARSGRNARYLGKKEVFDVPVIGAMMLSAGGIRVDRGTGSDEPLDAAIAALKGGDIVFLMPQGTIPRGPAFFDAELKGRWGAAKLATAAKVPIVPVGLWGTEQVWPRSARLPNLNFTDPPPVTATVGEPLELVYDNLDADTDRIMRAISDLLPPAAHEHYEPTEAELAATYPPGYSGDPEQELDRRPGTDT